MSIHWNFICSFFWQLLNLSDAWFINFRIVKLFNSLVQTFEIFKLHVNVLLNSYRFFIINPDILIIIIKRIFRFLLFLWWSFFLLNVSLLHNLFVQGVGKHIIFINRCLLSKVFLEFEDRKINIFLFLFKITKIIYLCNIGVRYSKR